MTPDDLAVCPATLDGAGARLQDTRCVWTELPLPPTLSLKPGVGFYVAQETETAALERVEGFPLAPSLVVDQGWSLLVGYLLRESVRLDSPSALHRVEAAQRALAERLGCATADVTAPVPGAGLIQPGVPIPTETTPAWHPSRRVLRLPGSANHDHGGPAVATVELKTLNAGARYALEQIEDGCGNGRGKGGK